MTRAEIYALTEQELEGRCALVIGGHSSTADWMAVGLSWLAAHVLEPFHITHSMRSPENTCWVIRLGGGGTYIGYGELLVVAVMRSVLIVSEGV